MKYRFLISIPFFIIIFLLYLSSFKLDVIVYSKNKDNKKGSFYLVPVLLFHNIDGKGPYSITREELRMYFDILKKEKIQIVSLNNLYKHAIHNQLYEKPTMVITIDDNYMNIVRVLAPILREYNYPATFFFYIRDIYSRPSMGTSWEDLQRLLKEGFDIQNHSYSHGIFHRKQKGDSEIDYQRKIFKEVMISKQILEKKLKHTIWAFAYPMGFYNLRLHHELLTKYGYKIVLTTDARPLDLTKKFTGVIHRYTIQKYYVKDPIKMFYLQISYAKRKRKSFKISYSNRTSEITK